MTLESGKKLALSTIFFLALLSQPYASCDETSAPNTAGAIVLALKDAINTAIMNNRNIQIQEEDVAYARANIVDATSAFLPHVSTGFDYTHNDSVLNPGPIAVNNRKDPGIFGGYKNDNLWSISATESIYNGGANIANFKQSKIGLKVQQETLRATKLEMEFETKRLFYGLLLAYETKRIAQDLVDQAQAHYEEVNTQFGQGTASKFDVLQSKVQVSRLMPQLVNADNSIYLIMAEFKKLLTINMKDEISIKGLLRCSYIDATEDLFLQEAYSRSPQMILKLLGVDMDKWGIEFAKAGWLPQVAALANYSYRSDDFSNMVNPRHDNWSVGVTASISLFDGFSTKAKVDEAKARYNQANLQKSDIIDAIAVDIKDGCLNLKKAKTVIESQEDSIGEAKEALRLSEVRFKNGVGINLDVLDAQVSLAQVEQNLAQGIYDYIMAKAFLDKTMGREFFKEDKDGT